MRFDYDTVIIGAGGAGLYAALESSGAGKTAVLSKLYPSGVIPVLRKEE